MWRGRNSGTHLEFQLREQPSQEFKATQGNQERLFLWRKGKERRGAGRNSKGYNIQQVTLGAGQNVQKEAKDSL